MSAIYDKVQAALNELAKETTTEAYNIAFIVPLDFTKYQTASPTVLIEKKAPPLLRSIFQDQIGFIFLDSVALIETKSGAYVKGEDHRKGKIIFSSQTSVSILFAQFINSKEAAIFCLRGI